MHSSCTRRVHCVVLTESVCFKFPFQPCETTTPISSSHFRFLPQVSAELKVDVKFNTSNSDNSKLKAAFNRWVAKLNVKTSSNTFQKPCQKQTDFKQVWWMLKSPISFSKFHSNPFGTCWEFSHKTSNFDFVVESKQKDEETTQRSFLIKHDCSFFFP